MNKPLVSIIIPIYNGAKFLTQTVESCICQTCRDIEIILIDDCSKDNSVAICKEFTKRNINITLVENKVNLGLNQSANKAANLSKGEYLLVLGHDDLLPNTHIEHIIKEFEADTSFVYCNSVVIDSEEKEIKIALDDDIQRKKTENIEFELSQNNIIISTGLIMRKKCFLEVGGYDERYRNYGEWLLWIKLIEKGKCKYSTKSRAYYRRHESNITNTFSEKKVIPLLFQYHKECCKRAYKLKRFTAIEKNRFYLKLIKRELVYKFKS